MKTSNHLKVIAVACIGVVVDADGTVFATQLFSTISYSQMESRNRFNRF